MTRPGGESGTMTAAELALRIDHTLLKAEATPDHIDRLCDEAVEHGFGAVFVNPIFVERAVSRLNRTGVAVGTVAGFPLGASMRSTVVEEARRAIEAGAREVDMVAWIGGLAADESAGVARTIYDVACVVHGGAARNVLKVILETRALDEEHIVLGCRCAAEGEADFVKTSTGFHLAGGATVEDVALLHRHASPLKVKASGGIRTLDQAMALIDAGAARIGTSSAVAIMRELASRR